MSMDYPICCRATQGTKKITSTVYQWHFANVSTDWAKFSVKLSMAVTVAMARLGDTTQIEPIVLFVMRLGAEVILHPMLLMLSAVW